MTRRTLLTLPVARTLTAQQSEAKGKAVVEEAIRALGGNAFLGMQDRVEQGRAYTFYQSQLSGLTQATFYTRYLTPPEPMPVGFFGVRERQVLGKDGSYYFLFTEEESYEVTYRGAKPVGADLALRFRESMLHNVLYILRMRRNEPGIVFDHRGTDVFDNQPVETVDIVDSENRQTSVWFHFSTKLPVRQFWVRRDPQTRDRFEEVTLFTKYRNVGNGALWPFQIRRERNGEKTYEMFAESVEVNKNLTDELFTLPGTTKILDKQSK